MDIEAINSRAFGKSFYNKIQVLEFLVFTMFSLFTQITIIESTDDYTRIQVDTEKEKIEAVITYLSGALMIDSDKFTLVLYIKHYIREFDKKSYTVDDNKKFSALLRIENMKNLYASVKREFIQSPTLFNQLSKNIMGEILSFLDNKSLLRFMLTKREICLTMNSDQMWKRMYYARYGNLDWKIEGLNWKKIYLQDHMPKINKSLSNNYLKKIAGANDN